MKKSEMEARLQKVCDIDKVLPRGLRIENEEHNTPRKNKGTTFFSNYKQQQSLRRFKDFGKIQPKSSIIHEEA